MFFLFSEDLRFPLNIFEQIGKGVTIIGKTNGEMWHANFEWPSNGVYQDIKYVHGETDQSCDEMEFQIWPSSIKHNGHIDIVLILYELLSNFS